MRRHWSGFDFGTQSTGTGASALSGLTDVSITSATTNQILQYDGALWKNVDASTSAQDETFELYDDGDATKRAEFELRGMPTGSTRI